MVPESVQVSAKDDIKASKGRRPACKGTKAKANMIMVTSLCIEPTVSSITPIDGSEGAKVAEKPRPSVSSIPDIDEGGVSPLA
ncbi:hypothetical protein EMCRGX_G026487 [Ephydatia muelleri]